MFNMLNSTMIKDKDIQQMLSEWKLPSAIYVIPTNLGLYT